jgi:hypothetical protein
LACSGITNVDISQIINTVGQPITNSNGQTIGYTPDSNNAFNVFTGGQVNLSCGTIPDPYNSSIQLPGVTIPFLKYPYGKPNLGQLELIAQQSVVITGGFQNSGYFVAKTDANLCNEYSGPIHPEDRKPVRDSTKNRPYRKKTDSLTCFIKNSLTRGEFAIGLNNIKTSELNQIAEVTVYTTLGQTLFTEDLVMENGNELQIDLSNRAKGLYLIIIRTPSNIFRKKVVIQ